MTHARWRGGTGPKRLRSERRPTAGLSAAERLGGNVAAAPRCRSSRRRLDARRRTQALRRAPAPRSRTFLERRNRDATRSRSSSASIRPCPRHRHKTVRTPRRVSQKHPAKFQHALAFEMPPPIPLGISTSNRHLELAQQSTARTTSTSPTTTSSRLDDSTANRSLKRLTDLLMPLSSISRGLDACFATIADSARVRTTTNVHERAVIEHDRAVAAVRLSSLRRQLFAARCATDLAEHCAQATRARHAANHPSRLGTVSSAGS
jgi:hypothetical protein